MTKSWGFFYGIFSLIFILPVKETTSVTLVYYTKT